MANISFYKYLEAAFRYKIFNAEGQRATFNTHFNYLGYNLNFERIFYYARRGGILPKFYTNKFPNTEEGNLGLARAVLEKLDKHQDSELENFFKGGTGTEESQSIEKQAQAESATGNIASKTVVKEPVGAMTGGTRNPSLQPIHTTVQNSQSAPKPDKADLSTQARADINEALEKGGIDQLPASKTVSDIFNKAFENEPEFKTNPSINPPSIPPAFSNMAQNAGAKVGLPIGKFIRRNLTTTRIATGFSAILGGIVGGGLTNGSSMGILAGALGGAATPSFIKSGAAGPIISKAGNGIINVGVNLTNTTSRVGGPNFSPSALISPKKGGLLKFALVGVFLTFFGFSLISGIINPGNTSSPSNTPVSSTGINGLDYTLPLKDPSVVVVDIRDQIRAAFPYAKIDYWDTIISTTKAAGINPALALALWIEETGASQTTVERNGGAGIPTAGGALSLGHLGCAPKEDQTINESLNCLIKMINSSNFLNNDFPQFMAKYSSGPASDPFANNPNFPSNFKSWYSRLVPSGVGAIQAIIAPNLNASCPIPNGKITTASYDADPINGHCGKNYGFCPSDSLSIPGTLTRRAKSIDISGGSAVYFPTVENQTLNWKYAGSFSIDPGDCELKDSSGGCGIGLMFQATTSDNHTWTIHLIHMEPPLASQYANSSQTYSSGSLVGYIAINHLHATIGKDLQNITARYDPGWLASDFMCK